MALAPQMPVPVPINCASAGSTRSSLPSHMVNTMVSTTTETARTSAPAPIESNWPSVTCRPSSTMEARSTGRTAKAAPGATPRGMPTVARMAMPTSSATTTGLSAFSPVAFLIRMAASAMAKHTTRPGSRAT